jgi:hypothetical protein
MKAKPNGRRAGQHWTPADLVLVSPLPSYGVLLYRAKVNPEFGGRFRAAIAARENPWLHRDDGFEGALEAIGRCSGKSLRQALAELCLSSQPGLLASQEVLHVGGGAVVGRAVFQNRSLDHGKGL